MYEYHCNLSPGEQKALFDLSHDEIIIIKKAGKSSSIVVMHHCDYIQEAERQLRNENNYEQLNDDPSENRAPSIPGIGEIMNKYWGLLALSQKSSVN